MDQKRPIGQFSSLVGDLEAIEDRAAGILDELATAREDMKELAAILGITQPGEVPS